MRFYIETFGCQMNQYDSRVAAASLEEAGHLRVQDPGQAEAYLVNSCSVRAHAEERLFKRLAELAAWKRGQPGRRLGLLGCTAQRLGEKVFDRVPHLDLVAGTESYGRLPALVERVLSGQTIVDIDGAELGTWDSESTIQGSKAKTENLSAFVAISHGCDNHCSYCIVPSVRGPERSRSVRAVLEEARFMVDKGVKEIVFLGQNVNSYKAPDSKEEREGSSSIGFADLLKLADEIPGIERIGFLTSHPKDLCEEILQVMAGSRHVAHHLHLPLQSGSDRILLAMNRKYEYDSYLSKVRRARELMPDLKLTTDLIAGFPGECEEDFQATLNAVKEIRFDEAFTFRYSEREGTPAVALPGKVPVPVRKERLTRLIALVSAIARERAGAQAARQVEILLEGPSRKDARAWKGRTRENREVIVNHKGYRPGDKVSVIIRGASGRALIGDVENETLQHSEV